MKHESQLAEIRTQRSSSLSLDNTFVGCEVDPGLRLRALTDGDD
jgi:hypothetical protein